MKPIIFPLFVCVCLPLIHQTVCAQDSAAPPVLQASDTQAIIAKDGQKITVKGMITTVKKSKSGTNFINFENSEFYLVTFKSDLEAFKDGEPVDLYQDKNVAVTGVVSIYKNKPQMKLLRPDMVKIITGDEPPPAPKTQKSKKAEAQDPKPLSKSTQKSTAEKKKKSPPVDPKKYFK